MCVVCVWCVCGGCSVHAVLVCCVCLDYGVYWEAVMCVCVCVCVCLCVCIEHVACHLWL